MSKLKIGSKKEIERLKDRIGCCNIDVENSVLFCNNSKRRRQVKLTKAERIR